MEEVKKEEEKSTVESDLDADEVIMKVQALFVVFNDLLDSDDEGLGANEELYGLRFICRDVLKELEIIVHGECYLVKDNKIKGDE